MKSKAHNFTRKNEKKPKTETEKEKALIELMVQIIVNLTLKWLYEKKLNRFNA
ncbi:hypothetical protein [Flavobacterium rhamnosiphilum]|uniref:hypothetical protein n=1 Tax=Flavobacterium rhamnosiphilum TaxID=2541724 RepID=UPI0014046D23|nr:hypothetical protein [Flavobacterium rhamnosiphilum]